MKKKISALLCMLLFLPCLLLITSCGEPDTFPLSLKSSDINYGSVNHADGEYEEGSQVKIKASPLGTSNFLCWAHNSSKIISNNKEYTVTINNETKGQYTAIFDQGCNYFVVSEVELSNKAGEFENYSVKVETGLSPTSLITVFDREDSLLKQNSTNVGVGFYNKYLVSKASLTSDFYCKLTVNETAVFVQNAVTLFDKDETTFTQFFEEVGNISITFTRLNAELVSQILA